MYPTFNSPTAIEYFLQGVIDKRNLQEGRLCARPSSKKADQNGHQNP